MAPCNSNVITPRMIRKGQIQIGDKIEFEPTAHMAASAEPEHTMVPEAVPAAVDTTPQPRAAMPQGNPTPSYIGQNAALQPNATMQPNVIQQPNATMQPNVIQQPNATMQPNVVQQPNAVPQLNAAFQSNTASIPLIYQNMTDYVNSLENTGQQSPSFSVPSSPLVPPEYEQTIDYDSVQYMNGFLRTQIGRYMRVEQLIGSDTTEDRYGFLVGVGNNYLLMQDISNGNISVVDLYSVKFAYIYFGEPVFPNIPFGDSGR